jgi:hypothetical protein
VPHTVDPEPLVLGGRGADVGRPRPAGVRSALRARAATPLLASLDRPARLTSIPEGIPVGALGAARAARSQVPT